MLLGPVRTHLTTWAGNTDCIAKINSRGESRTDEIGRSQSFIWTLDGTMGALLAMML